MFSKITHLKGLFGQIKYEEIEDFELSQDFRYLQKLALNFYIKRLAMKVVVHKVQINKNTNDLGKAYSESICFFHFSTQIFWSILTAFKYNDERTEQNWQMEQNSFNG